MITNQKNRIVSFLFGIAVLFFVACEEEDKTFQGDPIFAFQSNSVNLVLNQLEPLYNIPVMLVGPHQVAQKSITFDVLEYHVNVSGDTIRTTAVDGVHYKSFSDKSVVFDPNTSTAHIPLEVDFSNLTRGTQYTMVFKLTDGDYGTSEKANDLIIVRFLPHKYLVPESLEGTFMAREISNQPDFVREYEVTLELDSIHAGGRVFEYLVDGLWLIKTADSTAGAWDRQKIRIIVDDSSPITSVTTAPDVQNFFRLADGTFIRWNRRANRSFNTWENTFLFPSFNLKRADTDADFPPQPATPRGQNVRIELLGLDFQ